MGRRAARWIPVVVSGALLVGGCEDATAPEGITALTIRLTDAPGDLEEAWVRIGRIYLQGEGRVTLDTDGVEGLIDLLTLADGRMVDLVNGAAVPAGRYSEIRLQVEDAYVRTADGRVFATRDAVLPDGVRSDGRLVCPSCAQSGLKVKLPGGGLRMEEGTTVMVLDFDVSQSFGKEAGRSGNWVMRPVVHATRLDLGGAVAGNVAMAAEVELPSCGGAEVDLSAFVPRAILGTDTVASGRTSAEGEYRIAPLAPATYTLGHAPFVVYSNGDTLRLAGTADPASVQIAAGTTTEADYVVTSASCTRANGG
jgi:hypothetical protein